MSRFRFDSADDDEAGRLWADSPHASVFTSPVFLSRMGSTVDWWVARKGNEPICLWPVCRPGGRAVGLPLFSYYVGPMWCGRGTQTAAHRWLSHSTRVYEGLIRLFIERYGTVHAELPLGVTDVRVFDWWNYHQPDMPRFSIRPRYTACIHGLQTLTEEALHAGLRELRRRELRRVATTIAPVRVVDWTATDLMRFYAEVTLQEDAGVRSDSLEKIAGLVGVVSDGMGEVIAFRDRDSGDLTSAVLLLYGKGVANMVLNLTATKWRSTGMPAWTVYQAIHAARSAGANVFDFNGANSPERGDDKESYGAAPELFFEVRYPALKAEGRPEC